MCKVFFLIVFMMRCLWVALIGGLVDHLLSCFSGVVSCIMNHVNMGRTESKLFVLDWCLDGKYNCDFNVLVWC